MVKKGKRVGSEPYIILNGAPAKLSGAWGYALEGERLIIIRMVEKGEDYIILIGAPTKLSGAVGMPW